MGSVSALIGASTTQIWKPAPGVTAGSAAADAAAPFKLGTVILTDDNKQAVFCRAAGVIAIDGTVGLDASFVTEAAGVGDTYTNKTGAATVAGDYLFVVAAYLTAT